MYNKIIKYIITLLLLIIIFCAIPPKINPIKNIYLFVLIGLLVLYFFDTCTLFENFNQVVPITNKDSSNNNLKPLLQQLKQVNPNLPIVPQLQQLKPKLPIINKDSSNNNLRPLSPQIKPSPPLSPQLRPSPPLSPQIKPSPPLSPQLRPSPPLSPQIKPSQPQIKPSQPQIKPSQPQIKPSQPQIKPSLPSSIKPSLPSSIKPSLPSIPIINKDSSNNNLRPSLPSIPSSIKPSRIDTNINCNNNNKLILVDNIHDNIQKLLLPSLENIIYDENTIKFKSQINDIIFNIKNKSNPDDIYNRINKLTNLLNNNNSELYDLFKNILLILSSIINQKPINLNNINSEINNDIANELYIKKHFLPLFENLLLVILSYNKLPNYLQSKIKDIIHNITNDTNINNIFKKSKEINNNVLSEINDKQIISDKVAKTYLLMSTTILDLIIKNIKLIILQEPLELKSDIQKLNKDLQIIMKKHLGKILKLNISLENNLLNDSNIKTYLLVDFNPSNIDIDDESNSEISEMLKQLANKLDTNNSECNCENKVKEAVDKYLKNGKYVDDNGIIKNIMNSDMIYNQLDVSMLQSLGSYDNTFTNKWDKGYTYLDTSKWTVPKVQIPNPPNINNIMSSLTPGYPINLLEFDNSRKVLGPDNINLQYIKEKLN